MWRVGSRAKLEKSSIFCYTLGLADRFSLRAALKALKVLLSVVLKFWDGRFCYEMPNAIYRKRPTGHFDLAR